MVDNSYIKKRPCRICRKWFTPDPRLGDRQKTCGKEACKREWHTKKCAGWNKKNRSYFQAIYLSSKLESSKTSSQSDNRPPPSFNPERIRPITLPSSRSTLQLPGDVIQDVIGVQPVEIQRKIDRLPCEGCLRSDRLREGP